MIPKEDAKGLEHSPLRRIQFQGNALGGYRFTTWMFEES